MAAGLLLVYAAVVAFLVFYPSGVHATSSVAAMSRLLAQAGAPSWLGGHVVEFLANIAMFLPLGALGAVLTRRWDWRLWLLVGLSASSLIELVQLLVLSERSAAFSDIVANTVGAVVGAVAAAAVRRLASGF
jgi:glycopeptide antibiotics resistance protein